MERMESPLVWALGSVGVISIVSLVGAGTLSLRDAALRNVVFVLVSIATGALFGDALLHLIPEALEAFEDANAAMLVVGVGIVSFLILEKYLRWHHHHGGRGESHPEMDCPPEGHLHAPESPLAKLILVSDSVHNFLDGLIIAAAYLVSIEVGIATTLAVVLHEIPQEIGDFGVLVHAGLSRLRALFFNFLTALFAVAGAVVAFMLGHIEPLVPFFIAFAAGNFLYIAGSDLVPELHRTRSPWRSALQLAGIVLGFSLMYALLFLE